MKKLLLILLLLPSLVWGQTPEEIAKIFGTSDTTLPNEHSKAINVRNVAQAVERIGFTKTISGNIDTDWGGIVGSIGTGMAVNQTGGNLVITSGTTIRSETIIRSTSAWMGGIRLRARSTLSQRIANNNFFVELVDVIGDGLAYNITSATTIVVTIPSSPFTAINVGQSIYLGGFVGSGTFLSGRYPIASVSGNDVTFTVAAFAAGTGTVSLFGWNYYQLQYQGTTATQANFDVQRNGWASGVTTATINTSASPGHLAIITANDMNATFSDQLVASTTTVAQQYRASRIENVPDDVKLRLQIRVVNGTTAPASTTTWTIGMVSVSNYSAQDVSLQDIRSMATFTGLPVEVIRSVAITGTITANQGTAAATPWLANPFITAGAVTGDAGAKTTTGNGATLTNTGARGVEVMYILSAFTGTSPTITIKLQESVDAGTTWVDIPGATTATITAAGTFGIKVYPGITVAAGTTSTGSVATVSNVPARSWRSVWTMGGTTPSVTVAANYHYLY